DLASGKALAHFGGITQRVSAVVVSPDGKKLLVGQDYGYINIWDIASGRQTGTIKTTLGIESIAIDGRGSTVGAGGWDFPAHASTAKFWDLATGKELCTTTNDGSSWVKSMTIRPDLKRHLWTAGGNLFLSDATTGAILQKFHESDGELTWSAISSDGKYVVSGDEVEANIREVGSGKILKKYSAHNEAMRVGSDGKTVLIILSGNYQTSTWKVWDFASQREISSRTVGRNMGFGPIALSPDGKYVLLNESRTAVLWDIAKGKELRTFSGHTNVITSLGMSPDQTYCYSGSVDGTTRFWDVATGREIARFVAFTNGEWIVITPEGYFNASANGARYLNVRVGANVYSIDNFYEKFYNPSFVASVLKGRREETAVDMRKGIALPPQVRITSPTPGSEFTSDALTLTVSGKDMGGGIDEIRLYQNGKVVSEDQRGMKSVGTAGVNLTKSYQVSLLPGMNTFRAVAFNRERTESNPDEITVELKAAQAASDLYLFVVGINEYENTKYNLNYGKSDAMAFGNAVAAKSKTIFRKVVQYQLYDDQATRLGIEATFRTIAASAKPQDAFVFYYAGHGVMSEGSEAEPSDFYLIPSDVIRLYGDDALLASKGISAALLKTFCTTIKAQKQLVVLDACQSGGAVASFATRGASEERAIMQLARSAGMVLLASTGTEQFATEFSSLAHGVFTYALLQGLNGEADGGNPKDGKITVKELEAYLNDRVPELTKKYRGTAQYPNSFARGQDFPLGVR
ncbi:MAG TPA: caspase family protein, partial [Bacteroidota bacterium]